MLFPMIPSRTQVSSKTYKNKYPGQYKNFLTPLYAQNWKKRKNKILVGE